MKKTSCIIASAALLASGAYAVTSVTNANFGAAVTDTVVNQTYNIVSDITLGAVNGGPAGNGNTADTEYILEGFTFVNPGVTLTIEEGTIVRGQPFAAGGNPGSLVVSRGGAINARGLATSPIIFTTAADTNRGRYASGDTFLDANPATNPLDPVSGVTSNVGLWGAVTLLGYAPTNRGDQNGTVSPGTDYIEGFGLSGDEVLYGGRIVTDSSGVMEYVSIRHSGRAINEGDEQQGLTLGGVGSGTKLENIEIYGSIDDGIEIFGGTVNLKNIVISYVNDDNFDLDQGWTGSAQYVFLLAGNLGEADGLVTTDRVCEWDGEDGSGVADGITTGDGRAVGQFDTTGSLSATGQPFHNCTIYNMTIFADGADLSMRLRAGFGGSVYNSIIVDSPTSGFRIDGDANGNAAGAGYPATDPRSQLEAGTVNFAGITFVSCANNTSTGIGKDAWARAVVANDTSVAKNSANNVIVSETGSDIVGFGFYNTVSGTYNDQTSANGINPVPLQNVAATVEETGFFFDDVDYRGAFAADRFGALWTTGWTALNIDGTLVDNANTDSL